MKKIATEWMAFPLIVNIGGFILSSIYVFEGKTRDIIQACYILALIFLLSTCLLFRVLNYFVYINSKKEDDLPDSASGITGDTPITTCKKETK